MSGVEWGTVAGTLTAFATVITALGGLFVAIKVLIPTKKQIVQVHDIVNQQRTDMLNYQRALENVLKLHGIEVPADQSKGGETWPETK